MATATGTARICIDRPPHVVFAVQADPDNWPMANGGATRATIRPAAAPTRLVTPGAVFLERAGLDLPPDQQFEFHWHTDEVTPNRHLMFGCEVRIGNGITIHHRLDFQYSPSGRGTDYSRTARYDFSDDLLDWVAKDELDAHLGYLGAQYRVAKAFKDYVESTS
ncbi:SRPBCC family protein [Nocardia sp. CDC159]|uniref:SRPBCC family protein n=1 Tax=Nocardia pulmonis TaxID=2951408 RepID=A0A9X2EEM9_9NOCA|nr:MULTISPECIES: SRPBCC family protein [Nocardia]MCM6778925.1 SRPBCC family protein [Nocardia pulmonis]MCM6791822.1 SRPBCC family protein [Nocardia sp. CDC159]